MPYSTVLAQLPLKKWLGEMSLHPLPDQVAAIEHTHYQTNIPVMPISILGMSLNQFLCLTLVNLLFIKMLIISDLPSTLYSTIQKKAPAPFQVRGLYP